LTEVMFRVVAMIMKVAPLGALGAMAYTVGKFGIASLVPLAKLMACVYLTMALFIFVVLAIVCRLFGFSLLAYLRVIREEIVLVLGTSSSESALPRMIEKLERMGCSRGVVGLVIPAGYSFNLDGTSIYLSMAVMFIAQAYGIHLDLWQQLYVMGVLMLTSKGAAAVTGGGFVTLAATLEATDMLPVEGLALLLGVDRFMSEARAITNLIGNGVATVVVSLTRRATTRPCPENSRRRSCYHRAYEGTLAGTRSVGAYFHRLRSCAFGRRRCSWRVLRCHWQPISAAASKTQHNSPACVWKGECRGGML